MLVTGTAYWCSCSKYALLVHKRKYAQNKDMKYDRCYFKKKKDVLKEIIFLKINGVVRLSVPRIGTTTLYDIVRGQTIIANKTIDNQILIKNDGYPTYHLASVIDDHLMKISHILRGEEWTIATIKHILIYRALSFSLPYFCHLPLLRLLNKNKISKRNTSTALYYYKKIGILANTLINFLCLTTFSFFSNNECFSFNYFISKFLIEKINIGEPIFNLSKLIWLNGKYIREQIDEILISKFIINNFFCLKYLRTIVPLLRDRIETNEDVLKNLSIFIQLSNIHNDKVFYQINPYSNIEIMIIYKNIINALNHIFCFSSNIIKYKIYKICSIYNIEKKFFLSIIRLIITRTKKSPSLFLTMSILGRNRCVYLFENTLKVIKCRL